ncbi:hypothetical protein HPB47_026005 [Ixodes persulcatus]|uniref:Uncharacterized protein n=1 Tax=Ixodes persulcatus TaxID=34615 RepID=A0AC60Q045_IXOPE|nr:hypothetical protein HPB47_026005 [Ixodes persulcatus]
MYGKFCRGLQGHRRSVLRSPTGDAEERKSETVLLDPPSFSPLTRSGPPEPLHQNKKLKWDHKVNLIGEKLINPMIHCCDKCSLPIIIYGRNIPCKHVFCFDCAKKSDKICYRCSDKVQRLEPSTLGTVFMCTFGESRQGKDSCRRTYLSQRDLQAHITHRHLKNASSNATAPQQSATAGHGHPPQQQLATAASAAPAHPPPRHLLVRDPRQHPPPVPVPVPHPPPSAMDMPRGAPMQPPPHMQQTPPPKPHPPDCNQSGPPAQIPVVSRSNLITVQIHDDSHKGGAGGGATLPPQMAGPPPPQYATPPHGVMAPPPPQGAYPPPQGAGPPMSYPPPAAQPPYTQAPPSYTTAPPPPPPPARIPPPQFVQHQPPPQFVQPPPPRFASPYEETGHPPAFHWSAATNMPPPPRPMAGPPPSAGPPPGTMMQREPQFRPTYYNQ